MAAGDALAFTATGASRVWRGEPHDVGWLGPLAAPGMRTVFLVLGAFGTAVGGVQVLLPAFAGERGSAETGGLYLALLSAGSPVGGIVHGARSWPGAPERHLPVLLLALGAGLALLATAEAPAVLAVLPLACGLVLAPATVVASTLLDTAAPPGAITEAFRSDADGHRRRDGARALRQARSSRAAAGLGAVLTLARHRHTQPTGASLTASSAVMASSTGGSARISDATARTAAR